MLRTLIRKLQDERVIEIRRREQDGEVVHSLSHEVLVPNVTAWYDEREMQRKRAAETIDRGVVEYESSGALFDDVQVSVVRKWLPQTQLSAQARDLLEKSEKRIGLRKREAELQQGRVRRRTRIIWATTVSALFIVSFLYQRERSAVVEYDRLADLRLLSEYETEANNLWPARPENFVKFEDWLKRVQELADRLPDQERALHRLEANALPSTSPGNADGLRAGNDSRQTRRFRSAEQQWKYDNLSRLVQQLRLFVDPDPHIGTISNVRTRLIVAENLRLETVNKHQREWDEAIASIANKAQCPQYDGLKIEPQIGLVPIGKDSRSGLWEFAVPQLGEIPSRANGQLVLSERMALVLVLIPGGRFRMGAVKPTPWRPSGPNIDPYAYEDEGPVQEVELAPFFLSKFEMTQFQWQTFTGTNPSTYKPPNQYVNSLQHPVENVSWKESHKVVTNLGLELPTEAQMEYATRAGTTTVWWTGNTRQTLRGAANLADRSAVKAGMNWPDADDWKDLDDSYPLHSPVGSFRPNPFGLYDVHGNVWEWCRDSFSPYGTPIRTGDGERDAPDEGLRIVRNGDFMSRAAYARSAFRDKLSPDYRYFNLGLRPSKRVE